MDIINWAVNEKIKIRQSVPLASYTTARTGGIADIVLYPKSAEQIKRIYKLEGLAPSKTLLGRGSNVLAADCGVPLVVSTLLCNKICLDQNVIVADCGALLYNIAKAAQGAGLSGLENLSGIPGTLGGAIVINAGAYGTEIGELVDSVTVLDGGVIKTLRKDELQLRYRDSALKGSDIAVLSARLVLKKGDSRAIAEKMQAVFEKRRKTQPTEPSAGSVFKKTADGTPAAILIEKVGIKGLIVGGAQISCKHCNFIVNYARASTKDFVNIIDIVKRKVYNDYSEVLEAEIVPFGEINEDNRRLPHTYDL